MKIFLASALLCLTSVLLNAQTIVMLGWDANVETSCIGYRVLTGIAPRTYTLTNVVMGRTTTAGYVTNPPSGKLYFALVAFDSSGFDSDFSNEASWTNRLTAPKNLKLTGTIQLSSNLGGPWSDMAKVEVPLPPAVDKTQFYRTRLLLEDLP